MWEDEFDNPELRFPAAYRTFDEMLRHPQVNSAFASVILPILRTTWRIDGTGCREEVVRHVAADMSLPIVGEGDVAYGSGYAEERFSWSEHLPAAVHGMFAHGHAYFEQKAEFDPIDGRWHLVKLGYRSPRTITAKVARDGGLISLEQDPSGATGIYTSGARPISLPLRRVVVYTHDKVGTNWRGRSMLVPAYMDWRTDLLNRSQQRTLFERHASPSPVYEAAESESSLEAGKKVATDYRSGQSSGAAIPAGAKLHLPGLEGSLPNLDQALVRNSENIARAFRAHFLNLGTATGTGSYALSNALQSFFTLTVQGNAEEVARIGSRYVVRDIVDWNWGPAERAPRLVFDEIGSRSDALIEAIAALVTAGVLQPDEALEKYLRTTLGLPPAHGGAPNTPAQEVPA
ncbi:MAG: phage portal protein family protein [Mycobacteriales bacterium]